MTTELVEITARLTEMRMTVRYSSTTARDAALNTAMVEGMDEAYVKLDALLEGSQ